MMQNTHQHCIQSGSNAVFDVCRKLAALGYYREQASNQLDVLHQALHQFQQDHLPAKDFAAGVCDIKTWQKLTELAGGSFAEIWQAELDVLKPIDGGSKQAELRPTQYEQVVQRAHQENLVGLAFSGGGIRSATFNLGFLQALAEKGLLSKIDYLSTVSGGGYIGGWLSKWIKEEKGQTQEVERMLKPGTADTSCPAEPHEIKFLRQYSNYLTPRPGVFSADSWALLATWLRNTLLNMLLLICVLGAMMVVLHGLVFVLKQYSENVDFFYNIAKLFAVFAAYGMALMLTMKSRQHWACEVTQARVIAVVVVPLLLSAMAGSIPLWKMAPELPRLWLELNPHHQMSAHQSRELVWALLWPGLIYFFASTLGWLTPGILDRLATRAKQKRDTQMNLGWARFINFALGHLAASLVAMAAGSLILLGILHFLYKHRHHIPQTMQDMQIIQLLTLGVPLLFLTYGLAMVLHVGLLGRLYSEQDREWWSRLGGWTAIALLLWLALFAITFYAPPLISWLHHQSGGWASGAIGSGWLMTTICGLLAGHGSATSGGGHEARNGKLELLAAIAPHVFTLGILGLIASLIHFMLYPAHLDSTPAMHGSSVLDYIGHYLFFVNQANHINLGMAFWGLCIVAGVLAWRLDVNRFSLHMMSRNRVVRAYLGASSKKRNPDPFTGFDPQDDPLLEELAKQDKKVPYHILNASLNLVGGRELAWQNRKAANFIFSPLFCGYELPANYHNEPMFGRRLGEQGCFRPTADYGKDVRPDDKNATAHLGDEEVGVRLGMAIAISGAAVSPAMGYHSSPPLAFLMTLFNLRLGRWCANPRKRNWWRSGPRIGFLCLLRELLGGADANADYVYLSDGGHFENLGLYELVRRRCRFIILVDASADKNLNFDDLGNAIRKCYTDLAIGIEINVAPIEKKDGVSRTHCAVGVVRYSMVDQALCNNAPQVRDGILLYVKPTLTGEELADVMNYYKSDADFPHDSTANQWFDETRFESYRSLGFRTGKIVLQDALEQVYAANQGICDMQLLADRLVKRWQKGPTKTATEDWQAMD